MAVKSVGELKKDKLATRARKKLLPPAISDDDIDDDEDDDDYDDDEDGDDDDDDDDDNDNDDVDDDDIAPRRPRSRLWAFLAPI